MTFSDIPMTYLRWIRHARVLGTQIFKYLLVFHFFTLFFMPPQMRAGLGSASSAPAGGENVKPFSYVFVYVC